MQYYRLDAQGNPTHEPNNDAVAWAQWIQDAVLTICKTSIGDVVIETKFTGLGVSVPPEFWQTEIRGSLLDGHVTTSSGSRADAEAMHDTVVRYVKDFLARTKTNK